MKRYLSRCLVWAWVLPVIVLWGPVFSGAQETGIRDKVPEGVYIDLTRDFYRALRDEGIGETRVYSNDPSSEYLKEIAVSTRFMVETNLQILRLQERILRRLESLPEDRRK